MLEYSVHRFSAKGIRRAKMDPEDRVILLGDGTAIWYKHNVPIDFQVGDGPVEILTVDLLIAPDLIYRRKDSHLDLTDEPVPEILYAREVEMRHMVDHKMVLPIAKFIQVETGED